MVAKLTGHSMAIHLISSSPYHMRLVVALTDIIMVPQNDISGATRKAFLYTEKGYRNVIVEKYYGAKE